MLKRFLKYYKPHMLMFVLDLCAAFLVSICDLVYPIITRNMLNQYIPNRELRLLVVSALVLLLIYIIKILLNYFITYWGHMVGVHMQADMRKEVFEHLQKLPFTYYDEHETGNIMSRIINDLMDISELAHHGPEDFFLSFIMMVGSFIFLCTINFQLTLIIFAFIPVLIYIAMKTRKKMNVAFKESKVQVGVINATLNNAISGIRVSKAFTNSHYEEEKFLQGNEAFVRAREMSYKAMAQFHSGTGFIMDLLNVVVLLAGGIYTYYGWINFADFVTYMLFINNFTSPIRKLINFVEQLENGVTGFERFCELLDQPIEQESENAHELENVQGHIEFDHVSFNYEKGKEVLCDINLDIQPGKTIALVGPSGGGKTTICHLIPHFYPLDKGEIRIDGQSIKDITFESLRKNIGIVQQDVFLFTGTIKENIAYGNLEASDDEIIEAAKRANIHDYVMSLADGYDTQIGERGIKLSGGQKQRLSIARVFLKNPAILILDEATSALDNATEILIQDALDELCKGRTTIVVAHRLSTIKNADEIVVIEDHKVTERGTHEQLLANHGLYTRLYQAQFKSFE
ncbi:MAG: ABC transporter ATP-binding protein [Traorella sp.]